MCRDKDGKDSKDGKDGKKKKKKDENGAENGSNEGDDDDDDAGDDEDEEDEVCCCHIPNFLLDGESINLQQVAGTVLLSAMSFSKKLLEPLVLQSCGLMPNQFSKSASCL